MWGTSPWQFWGWVRAVKRRGNSAQLSAIGVTGAPMVPGSTLVVEQRPDVRAEIVAELERQLSVG